MSTPGEAFEHKPGNPGFDHPQAYCRGMDSSVFFPESRGQARHKDVAYARSICREHCLVMEGCLQHALREREEHGIWGGCKETERRTLLDILPSGWEDGIVLVSECERCERSFIESLDGGCEGNLCPRCRGVEVDAA